MQNIPATHTASGHEGEIQQVNWYEDHNGVFRVQFYFEDHARPTAAGWYPSSALVIPSVNA